MHSNTELIVLAALAAALALHYGYRRVELSRAKHRSLAGHARWSRRFAAWIPLYEYDESTFFSADAAAADIVARRRMGFNALAARYENMFRKSRQLTREIEGHMSDLQFTSRYRVPFQFSSYVQRHLKFGSLLESSAGIELRDLDGNELIDLSGSYGVNTFGYGFYKQCVARGSLRVADLGPVLGAYHPLIAYNVQRLREISGLDEVSFHMSGTEAVMQAVRLARYHSGRKYLVRFCGAYHGWWGGVQPGVGNPATEPNTFTLAELSEATLRVLRHRSDIACVLVNPLQALHPNRAAPNDSTLIDSGRSAHFEPERYASWLRDLREICTVKKIALIFDEVFVGFRLANGGAQEYFSVRADLVTYGKTVGGGLPVGVLCGTGQWMRRFRIDRPADVCLARGTFNSHPYVMGAMHEFLQRLATSEIQTLYQGLEETWRARAEQLNQCLQSAGLPIRVANLSSIWTVIYLQASPYNWMLQFYLRTHGIALSWVGTGRLIFSLNFTQADFDAAAQRILAAASDMHSDGWWSVAAGTTNRSIRRTAMREMVQAKWFRAMGSMNSPRSK